MAGFINRKKRQVRKPFSSDRTLQEVENNLETRPQQNPEAIPAERIDVARQSGVRELDLSNLRLTILPHELRQLAWLEDLDVSLNRLTTLSNNLGKLVWLQALNVSGNQLMVLPDSLGQLTQLQQLDVSDNQLTTLPESIAQLFQLRELHFFNNRLTTLPNSLGQLTQLRQLDVSGNQLTALPDSLGQLTQLERLFLHDNRELGLPPEILGPTREDVIYKNSQPGLPASILAYYFNSRASRPLNEAKMILVGRGGAGKTSLVQRLVNRTFNSHEKKTDGIAITTWWVQIRDDQVRLNIWDFGGQDIMHATHQFFMTKRSLYLLVLNAREGEQDTNLEYWLRLVESFGGDSPVIVVVNQIKQHHLDLNQRGLKEKFPAIREFIETDCEENIGLEKLRRAIERETDRLEHVRDRFPASWFTVKHRLANLKENLKENYITYAHTRPCVSNKL